MTLAAVTICIICQLCLVLGQLLLKHGMNATHAVPRPWTAILGNVGAGVFMLTLWFLLWLGLLQSWELSRVFPFEGLAPPLVVLGAWLVLGERFSPRAWVAIMMIGVGVALVAGD